MMCGISVNPFLECFSVREKGTSFHRRSNGEYKLYGSNYAFSMTMGLVNCCPHSRQSSPSCLSLKWMLRSLA